MKRLLLITTIFLSTTAGVSNAADMNFPVQPKSVYTNVEYGSGWYLRGDIGHTVSTESTLSYFSDDRYNYDGQSLGDASSWSIGAGYNFNDTFRADLTFERSAGHDWSGTSVGTICGGLTPGECYSEDDAAFDRNSVMANAYVSLGNYGGFSPYVGGGIGLTHVEWSGYDSDAYCTVDVGEDCTYGVHSGLTADPETFFGGSTSYDGESTTAFTYALATGFDYRLSQNWLMDVGYKYTNIQGAKVVAKDSNGPGDPQGSSKYSDLVLHEVKVGLRYEIW
jgi:opacity protein-like surface antigen